jgi:hypothetical protein
MATTPAAIIAAIQTAVTSIAVPNNADDWDKGAFKVRTRDSAEVVAQERQRGVSVEMTGLTGTGIAQYGNQWTIAAQFTVSVTEALPTRGAAQLSHLNQRMANDALRIAWKLQHPDFLTAASISECALSGISTSTDADGGQLDLTFDIQFQAVQPYQ